VGIWPARNHAPDDFMTWDDWQLWIGQVPIHNVQIGAANSACGYLDQ
jgi:hypothetical protein